MAKLTKSQRNLALQAGLLILIGLVIWGLVSNASNNLASQNIASGFAFLDERAGFGINQTLVEYDEDSSYGRVLLVGLLNTLLVAVLGIVLATLLGFGLGVARLSRNFLLRNMAAIYVELFRNTPLLLQIMFWYFGVLRNLPRPRDGLDLGAFGFLSNRGLSLPAPVFEAGSVYFGLAALVLGAGAGWLAWRNRAIQRGTGARAPFWRPLAAGATVLVLALLVIIGWPFSVDMPVLRGFNYRGGMTITPEFMALLLALSLYTAAFIGEIVRSGIQSVNRGQSEAAAALGLQRGFVLRFIIIPQAMRVVIPPLTSQYLNLTKNSSLAVAIAYPDIVSTFSGTALNQVGQAIEIIFITMLIYLKLSLLTSMLMNWYNARIALTER